MRIIKTEEVKTFIGDTVLEKAVCEHKNCGDDIYHCSDDAIEGCIKEPNIICIIGTKTEIEQILPYLREGAYCFIFEDERVIRYRHFREAQEEFLIEDAITQIDCFCDTYKVSDKHHKMLLENAKKIADYFERHGDCNIDENSIWYEATKYFYDKIKEEK